MKQAVDAKTNKNTATDWRESTLGEFVATRSKGIVPNKTPETTFELYSVPSLDAGAPEIVQGSEIGSNKQIVTEGTVLLCKINPRINRSWVVSSHSEHQKIASTEWITFPPNEAFEPKYLAYYLKQDTVRDFLAANASGVGGSLMRVKPATVKDYPFPLAPLDEQKRIVAEIEKQFSRLDEAVANLKRVKANLKRYKAAVLKAAVEGKLTEEWRKAHPDVEPASKLLDRILAERRAKWEEAELAKMVAKGKAPKNDKWKGKYKVPIELDDDSLPALPDSWGWTTLDSIGQEGRPIIYGIIKPGPQVDEGVPYVRVTEMKDGTIDVATLRKCAPERAAKFARATLEPGDILISKDGTIGRVAIVPPELRGGNITQHVMRAPTHAEMSVEYVVWMIRSPQCQRWLKGETKGVALRGVNVEDFRRLPIPVAPRKEQQEILIQIESKVSVVKVLEAQTENALRRVERLRQSVLAEAFSGRLCVDGMSYSIPAAVKAG